VVFFDRKTQKGFIAKTAMEPYFTPQTPFRMTDMDFVESGQLHFGGGFTPPLQPNSNAG
jgi:hypothetical protein